MSDLQPGSPPIDSSSPAHADADQVIPLSYVQLPPRRPYWLHALFFVLTVCTTLVVGAELQRDFLTGQPMFVADETFFPLRWVLYDARRLLLGVPFSAALLSILLAHELGHFLLSVRNRVYATLPFFIPAPTPFGTLGAFIKIKSHFRSRTALFDIAVAGPIAGFVVAIPMAIIGLIFSRPLPANIEANSVQLGQPLIFHLIAGLLAKLHIGYAASTPLRAMQLHPVAYAAWIGMLATSLNLVPGGQLDGGHIIYALRPAAHRVITWLAIVALATMTVFLNVSWFIWIFALLITRKHPPVPADPPLPGNRRWLAWAALLILALTLIPAPFPGNSVYDIAQYFRELSHH
jgi:membrane-associated protease RseP (regulator of RpoE activity)